MTNELSAAPHEASQIHEGGMRRAIGTSLITSGGICGAFVLTLLAGGVTPTKIAPEIVTLMVLGGAALALIQLLGGAVLVRSQQAVEGIAEHRPVPGHVVRMPYHTAAVLLGLFAGGVFLVPDLNKAPMWLFNGPPVLLANFLLPASENGLTKGLLLVWMVAYYHGLFYPGYRAIAVRVDVHEGTAVGWSIGQAGLLGLHLLLTGLLFRLMQF